WYKGIPSSGSVIAGANASTLWLTNVTSAQAGNYYAVVTNSSGTATSSVATLTVVHTIAPMLSGCPPNLTNTTTAGQCTAVASWTNPSAIDSCDGVVTVVCTPASGSVFEKGVTTVTCLAVDSSRNTNTCAFTVTVLDREPPVITGCPTNLTAFLLSGAQNAVATWIAPTAMDNCDGIVPVACTPPSGSTFGPGITIVIGTAVDSSGNTNTCAFTVMFVSPQTPRITDVRLSGSDVLIGFSAFTNSVYSLEATENLVNGGWSAVLSGISGNDEV